MIPEFKNMPPPPPMLRKTQASITIAGGWEDVYIRCIRYETKEVHLQKKDGEWMMWPINRIREIETTQDEREAELKAWYDAHPKFKADDDGPIIKTTPQIIGGEGWDMPHWMAYPITAIVFFLLGMAACIKFGWH